MALHSSNYVRITVFWGGGSIPHGAACVQCVEDLAGDPLADINTAFQSAFEPVVEQLTTVTNAASVLVKRGPDETGPSALFSWGHGGLEGSAAVPPNTSVLVSKQTAVGGRRGRGRMFLPGIREDRVDVTGLLDPTNVGNINNALDSFMSDMTTAGYPLMLEHGDDPSPLAPTELVAMECQSTVATQRRRLRR